MRPLVVTASLDPDTQDTFDALRRRHFPQDHNHLAAHLTLFHAVPGEHQAAVTAALTTAARRAPLPVRVTGPRLLGRGVAIRLDSAPLLAVRARLAQQWWPWLTRQDQSKNDLHVTVQNKVDPAVARRLHAELAAGGLPSRATVTGLALWRYLGGPWEPIARFPLTADDVG